MPEGPEVEKLRRQLEFAWRGCYFTRIESIWDPLKSGKYWHYATMLRAEFEKAIENKVIESVVRYGKWICTYEKPGRPIFAFHLGGTGWFLPGPGMLKAIHPAFPHQNFLHKVNEQARRLRFHGRDFGIGSPSPSITWDFFDGRTWAKFIIPDAHWKEWPWINYGPDWINDQPAARTRLQITESKSKRLTVKQVLCDQYITAGLGNYLSCEACFVARIRPNKLWKDLSLLSRRLLAQACSYVVDMAMERDNHDHWNVFKREGDHCHQCSEPILYEKDPGGSRGSYFCANCQS